MAVIRNIAQLISIFSSPIIVIGLSLFYVVFHFAPDYASGFQWFAFSVSLIGVAPAFYIWLARRAGHIKDLRLSRRQDRFGPFIVACFGMIVTILVFYKLDIPTQIILFIMSVLLILLVASFITLFWKISIHALAITAIVMTINMLSGFAFWYAFILPPFVMWSRVETKRHTVAQVVAGMMLSTVIVYVVYSLFGISSD